MTERDSLLKVGIVEAWKKRFRALGMQGLTDSGCRLEALGLRGEASGDLAQSPKEQDLGMQKTLTVYGRVSAAGPMGCKPSSRRQWPAHKHVAT